VSDPGDELPGDELVDVVDDAGLPIATVTRREMRARRLPHRVVYLLVFNRRGELFIHLRTPVKDVYPGYWDVAVGGVLAAGETFEAGGRRELAEELGVEAPLGAGVPFRYADAATVLHGMIYATRHDGPFRLQAEEIVRGEFVDLPTLDVRTSRDSFCPDGLAALGEYRRRFAVS
jgi:isopentenyldiphosphate isomerase